MELFNESPLIYQSKDSLPSPNPDLDSLFRNRFLDRTKEKGLVVFFFFLNEMDKERGLVVSRFPRFELFGFFFFFFLSYLFKIYKLIFLNSGSYEKIYYYYFSSHINFKFVNNAHRLPPKYFPLIINGRNQIDCYQDVETKLTVTKM